MSSKPTSKQLYQIYLDRKTYWINYNAAMLEFDGEQHTPKPRRTDSDDQYDEYRLGWGDAPLGGWKF